MGIKTKWGGPGPFYHHMNDADVYLGGSEGGVGGGVASVKREAQAQIFRHAPDLTVRP